MSLTSLLNRPSKLKAVLKEVCPSKQYFTSNTAFPAFSKDNPLLIPCVYQNSSDAGLIGRAADYLFRFIVARAVDHKKEDVLTNLEAEKGLSLLCGIVDKSLFNRIQMEFNNGISSIRRFVYGDCGNIEILANTALLFSYLEQYSRSGALPTKKEDIIERRECAIIKDIVALSKQFEIDFIISGLVNKHSDVIYNPDFGQWSKMCGGADADIYIDGVLYDFKCTKSVYKDWTEIGQVYGYYLLYQLCQVDNLYQEVSLANKPIDEIAIYKARYGLINKCKISESDAKNSSDVLQKVKKAIEADRTNNLMFPNTNSEMNSSHVYMLPSPVHTMELTQRNFTMGLRDKREGTKVYTPIIGFGTIVSCNQSSRGTSFIIESDKKTKYQCSAIEFCKSHIIVFTDELADVGKFIVHSNYGFGKVVKKDVLERYTELHVVFNGNRERIISDKDKEYYVARKPLPKFNNVNDFPYKVGEIAILQQKVVLVSGFENIEGNMHVILQDMDGNNSHSNIRFAAIRLYEETPRNDIALLDAISGKPVRVNDSIQIGDRLIYIYKRKQEKVEGTVSNINKSKEGVVKITVDFNLAGKVDFLGSEFCADFNSRKSLL